MHKRNLGSRKESRFRFVSHKIEKEEGGGLIMSIGYNVPFLNPTNRAKRQERLAAGRQPRLTRSNLAAGR
jgi:hypothetical protein